MWRKKKEKKKEGKHSVRVPSNSSRNSFQCVNDRLWIFSSSFVLVVVLINTVKSGRWCCSVRLTLCQGGDTNHKQKLRSRKRVSHQRLVTWPNRKKDKKTSLLTETRLLFYREVNWRCLLWDKGRAADITADYETSRSDCPQLGGNGTREPNISWSVTNSRIYNLVPCSWHRDMLYICSPGLHGR